MYEDKGNLTRPTLKIAAVIDASLIRKEVYYNIIQ